MKRSLRYASLREAPVGMTGGGGKAMILIRKAEPGEAESLTALCVRSKVHWGYDAEFMRLCMAALTVSEASIAAGRVLVARHAPGRHVPARRGGAGGGEVEAR